MFDVGISFIFFFPLFVILITIAFFFDF